MRFHHVSEDLFSSQTAVRVLRSLVRAPAVSFTGREVAADSATPPVRALERLRRLEAFGLVQSRAAGRSRLWQLHAGHVLVPALAAWFDAEDTLLRRLAEQVREALAPLPFVRRVMLFGSVARGDERPDSDVDIFVLVDHEGNKHRTEEAVRALAERVRSTFTNPLRALIYDQREWERKAKLGVVRSIRTEGRTLVDKPHIKTQKLDRSQAGIYLRKAEEFLLAAKEASSRDDWNAVGLGAVHAVISACDAVTTAKLGIRSRDSDHEQAADLVRQVPSPEAPKKAEQALQVLQVKNQVEYEARLFEKKEALVASRQAERLVAWVRRELGP